jgi:hypothetical protein
VGVAVYEARRHQATGGVDRFDILRRRQRRPHRQHIDDAFTVDDNRSGETVRAISTEAIRY